MSRNMGTQHRPSRDDRKSKELAELRSENSHLKKQVARLRRQIEKMVEIHGLNVPEDDEQPMEKPPEGPVCEKCGGTDLTQVSGNGKVFLICKNKSCLWRKVLPSE